MRACFYVGIPKRKSQIRNTARRISPKKIQEHQVNRNKACHATKLIFDEDSQILKQLKAVFDKFFQLSFRKQELLISQDKAFVEAMSIVQKVFPNRTFTTQQDITTIPETFDMAM